MFDSSTYNQENKMTEGRPTNTAGSVAKKPTTDIISEATKVVAPSWPLNSFVAVNPFWNMRQESFYQVLAKLSNVYGQSLFLPLESYLEHYSQGRISDQDITKAIGLLHDKGLEISQDLSLFLRESRESTARGLNFLTYSDFVGKKTGKAAREQIVEQVSRYCASYFDIGQAAFGLRTSKKRLYTEWLSLVEHDQALSALGLGDASAIKAIASADPVKTIEKCAFELGLSDDLALHLYITKVCHHLMGWASHVSYHLWQETLGLPNNGRGTSLQDLIAMFMVYECRVKAAHAALNVDWQRVNNQQLTAFSQRNKQLDHNFQLLSVWQRALEWGFQKRIANEISARGFTAKETNVTKDVQMVFCIDVRSEVIRRNIEKNIPSASTHGFAGFFGVTLQCDHEHKDLPSYRCPVLLQPKVDVGEDISIKSSAASSGVRSFQRFMAGLKQGLASSFAYVEFFGAMAGVSILKRSVLPHPSPNQQIKRKFDDTTKLTAALDLDAKVATATFALTHMGLRNFAPTVMICGHGSVTTNNAFASSLDCGACGGHAGDLNARVLCSILNDTEVRGRLRKNGKLNIPDATRFVPAIHETVTDRIIVLEESALPAAQQKLLSHLQSGLTKAAEGAQAERKGISANECPTGSQRVTNWAEVRPEWALVNNGCFVVAPRARTTGVNLQGRSFLHDYEYTIDEGMKTLELVMTAPMVVTNWINMQYYASSVCMDTFGSGNKTLHNIVGQFGVLEGYTGDLKIGLPFQSVHDGSKLIHEPLRLSVYIEAPQAEIDKIIANHAVVSELVDNHWLYIFAIDRDDRVVRYRRSAGNYEKVTA